MLLFWLTPVIYDIRSIPESLRLVVHLNPVSYFVLAYQDVLYHGVFPSGQTVVALVFLTLFMLVLGYTLFIFLKFRFAEEV